MKKIIYLSAFAALATFTSCTKNNDFVKEQLENALPTVEVTSMGLLTQVGPFATTDVIQVTFGGAITKAAPGTVDFAWYDASKLVDSVHFNSWSEVAAATNENNSVDVALTPASYPNTNTFSGNLILKLGKLPSGKSYNLSIYVRTDKGDAASITQTKFVTIK